MSMWLEIFFCLLAGWMLGFIMGRMSQPSATLTPAELLPEQVKTLKLEKGDTIILRYPGVFNVEQREAVHRMFAERYKDQEVEVLVLEAGLDAEVLRRAKAGSFYDPYSKGEPARRALIDCLRNGVMTPNEIEELIAEGKISISDVREAQARRRDDSRQNTQPEGDWEEKA